jgi:Ca2+-dependent lipid-binding protein
MAPDISPSVFSAVSQGLLRLEIELVPEFPHAKTVLVTFLEKPIIDFKYVGPPYTET